MQLDDTLETNINLGNSLKRKEVRCRFYYLEFLFEVGIISSKFDNKVRWDIN